MIKKKQLIGYILESLIDIIKHEQGHFDVESILFVDLNSRSKQTIFFSINWNFIQLDLTDANSLSACRNLIILNLNNNNLTNVRGFGTLLQLQILSLSQNQINSLDGLQTCDSLEILNIAGNNLTG
jgi:Leucine-rich repeat (LRR) protein